MLKIAWGGHPRLKKNVGGGQKNLDKSLEFGPPSIKKCSNSEHQTLPPPSIKKPKMEDPRPAFNKLREVDPPPAI